MPPIFSFIHLNPASIFSSILASMRSWLPIHISPLIGIAISPRVHLPGQRSCGRRCAGRPTRLSAPNRMELLSDGTNAVRPLPGDIRADLCQHILIIGSIVSTQSTEKSTLPYPIYPRTSLVGNTDKVSILSVITSRDMIAGS